MIVGACDPGHPDALALLEEPSAVLTAITGDSGKSSFAVADARVESSLFVVARDAAGGLLGCGALRPLDEGVAEVKRMYARAATSGVAAALLAHLEREAGGFGCAQIWLATRRVNTRAIAFYRKQGYAEIAGYGKYVGRDESICMGKHLG